MSSEEQDTALLRLVKDRAEAKRKWTLLQSELQAAAKAFREIGAALQNVNPNMDLKYMRSVLEKHTDVAAPSKLLDMLKEYIGLTDEVSAFDAKAKSLGLD
jgi:hypothetical protein